RVLSIDLWWRTLAIATVADRQSTRNTRFFLHVDLRGLDEAGHSPRFTRRLIEAHGLDPARFVLSLTDHGDADPYATRSQATAVARLVTAAKRDGLGIALDQGRGRWSLEAIGELRPGYLTLGESLVRGLGASPKKLAVVRSLVRLAGPFGIRVMASGI